MPFSRSLAEGLFEIRFIFGSTARPVIYRFNEHLDVADRAFVALLPGMSQAAENLSIVRRSIA